MDNLRQWIERHARSVDGQRLGVLEQSLADVQDLDVSGAPLEHLPEDLDRLTSLRRLNLSRTNLRSLPAAVYRLTELRELNVSRCGLEEIAPSIGRLTRLEQLLGSRNQLTSVPEEIGQLVNIRIINIRNNRLSGLPESLGRLAALYELDASENEISQLPRGLGSLRSLRNLYVSGNNLTSLPDDLSRCIALRSLALSGNLLTVLDDHILELPELETLWLYDNPLENPPPEIADRGLERIRIWLHARRRAESGKDVSTVRALVLGAERVGKSSLVDRLVHNSHNPRRRRTPSMTDTAWRPREDLEVRLWDFGGQKPMHDVHRLFLAKRAAVVLVVDDQTADSIDYWLRLAEPVAASKSVLVVLNKIDRDVDLDVDRRSLVAKWPAIAGFVRCSMRSGDGIDELVNRLTSVTERVARSFPRLPGSWGWVDTKLTQLDVSKIDRDLFTNICAEAEVADRAEADALLDYLEDTGSVIVLDGGTTQTIVIEPRWLVDAIYQIVNHPAVQGKGGTVHMSAISAVLAERDYTADDAAAVVSAMVDNDFAFVRGDELVIPSLLFDRRPSLAKPQKPLVRLDVRLSHLPPGFFARLLTKLGGEAREIWRSGIRVTDEAFRASGELIVDPELHKISVSVWGAHPRDYISVLRHRISDLAREANVEVDEFIPLSHREKAPLWDVLAHEAAGVTGFLDVSSQQQYDVSLLLNGRKQPMDESGDVYNIEASNVSFGEGTLNVAMGSRLAGDLRALIDAVANSNLSERDELVERLTEAGASGDVGRIRRASLAALDTGAKISSISTAATALLNHL